MTRQDVLLKLENFFFSSLLLLGFFGLSRNSFEIIDGEWFLRMFLDDAGIFILLRVLSGLT
jgi:hypothetical protein